MGEVAQRAAEIGHAGDILLKPIFLQTTPHTGTNTAFYLFNYLGGIPVYFLHFGDWELSEFVDKIKDVRDEFVWLHTFRPWQDIVATYAKRVAPEAAGGPNSAEELVNRNMVVEGKWKDAFSEAILLPIVNDPYLQTYVALSVFHVCGVEVPEAAKGFMKAWPPVSTFPTGEKGDLRGFESEEQMLAMRDVMRGMRVLPKNRGEDKLNEFIEGLSNDQDTQ